MLSPADLYTLLSNLTSYDGRSKLGTIILSSNEILELFKKATANTESTGWDDYNNSDLKLGATVEVEVHSPQPLKYGNLYYSFENFLSDKSNLLKQPSLFYIYDIKFHPNADTKDPLISRYKLLLEFNETLNSSCMYLDKSKASWFFIHGDESVDISPTINVSLLKAIDEDIIRKVIAFFKSDNIHHKQKCTIFSKILVKQTHTLPNEERYKLILENIESIYEKLEDDYSAFAAEFSYEKIINQIENDKLEEQVKIHKVLTDIQAQILGIPVATVIIATQYKLDTSKESSFWINLSILLGAFIFSALMNFSAHNQQHTLKAIKKEIDRKQKLLTTNFPKLAKTNPYKGLYDRIAYQRLVLLAVQWIVSIGFIIAFVFFLKITELL